MKFKIIRLQLFAAPNTNTTGAAVTGNDLSASMKTFYKTSFLENERHEQYFNQFGEEQPLPKNEGNIVEWRRMETFAKALTPLTEGVTPDGNKLNMSKITQKINQYGDYTTLSDRLEMEAVDPIVMETTEEHGAQAGETLETVTRNEVMSGTNVIYAGGKTSRADLTKADVISPTLINQAVTFLKKMHAPKDSTGCYIGILPTSVIYDLRQSNEWIEAHKYAKPDEIYNGEVGKIHGCRIIDDPEGKIYKTGVVATYGCVFFGKKAYGRIKPTAEALEIIVKQKGSAGSSDPLNQRSSVGWKASHAAKILYQERIIRIECGSFYSDVDDAN